MDVYGRKPATLEGRYFRATITEWSPIYQLTAKLFSDLLDRQTFEEMALNQGAGPKNQKTCKKMADRFEAWMRENPKSSYRVKHGLHVLKIIDSLDLCVPEWLAIESRSFVASRVGEVPATLRWI